MSTTIPKPPQHGTRTLPQTLDILASETPHRLYASIPQDRDLAHGFRDVSVSDMARCVDFMASWIVERFGKSKRESGGFETVAYVGVPDLRSVAAFLGAVKVGYKVLLPSPRNPPATNLSLMQQTQCTKVLYTVEVAPVIKQLDPANSGIVCLEIPSFDEILQSSPEHYEFNISFEKSRNDPIVILHSSGSTGLPKPITMTHTTFAVLDRERNLPTVPGRRNRDYSIWDFNGGGRFYTVFPYFHLAGFLCLLVNPIFTESSSPVLGPPLMPPSGALLKEVMRHQNLRALYLLPSIAEQLLLEPNGIDFFKDLDFVAYTGGPFSPSAGEKLSSVTELCPLYGSTEAFQVPQLAPAHPENWAWMEWNPCFKLEMQADDSSPGAFELVLYADSSTEDMSALNHNMPGVSTYRTKDLFKQHPTKKGLWQYYSRRDDIIVLSNGEKFNPVPAELKIQGHTDVAGALIVGHARSRATLLVESKTGLGEKQREELKEAIWPLIESANQQLLPAQGKILRGHLIIGSSSKPFTRAGKGTIVRKLTEKLYEQEINTLYANIAPTAPGKSKGYKLHTALKPHYEIAGIVDFVRDIIADLFPDLAGITNDDDLFSSGLDSVMIGQLINALKSELGDHAPHADLSWLDTRLVYRNSSIERLSEVICQALNSGKVPEGNGEVSRKQVMDDMVLKYTDGLTRRDVARKHVQGPRNVAIVGSTGYLGPRILASLLADANIASIYCLNRGEDGEERTAAGLKNAGIRTDGRFQQVQFFSTNLSSSQLGLSVSDFNIISSTVDTIIYNSWKPDWTLPLHSFEKPFLIGLRNIIDWSVSSPKVPQIVFISSIAAVGNWTQELSSEPLIPELPIKNSSVALHMGYGESKCVAERVLQVAHERCGIPVKIIRFGQLGGPARSAGGTWPIQGWLLAMIKTSKILGVVPTNVAPVDWIAVDILARQISDAVADTSTATDYRVFNLVHSDVVSWDLFLETLIQQFGLKAKKVSLSAWLDKLGEAAKSERVDSSELVALKFLDFLRSMGEGREDMRSVSANIQKISHAKSEPLTQELLAHWLKDWDL